MSVWEVMPIYSVAHEDIKWQLNLVKGSESIVKYICQEMV